MAKNLSSLTIKVLDELAQLRQLQDLLEIYMEQGEQTPEKQISRAELLVSSYLPAADNCIHEMKTALEKIQELLGAEKEEQNA